jgi:hypothetical protein
MNEKLVIVFVVFLLVATAASSIDLGNFPSGSWIDANYDALWTFSTDNIVLSYTDGEEVFDFNGKIDNFLVAPGANGIEVSFNCEETGWGYKFVKTLDITQTSVKMFIERTDGLHYEVVMLMKEK